jgi:hypothetical protein
MEAVIQPERQAERASMTAAKVTAPNRLMSGIAAVMLMLAAYPSLAADKANGLTLDPPAGWRRAEEGANVVYRAKECSLSVLAPRPLGSERPVPFFQQTWNSVKGALRVLREQPPAQMRTLDGSIGRHASAVVDSGADERAIAVFMAADTQSAHFIVFTGPVPPCDGLLGEVERAMRSVSLSERGTVPERM